jgi:plasmid stabilization system protein ParE
MTWPIAFTTAAEQDLEDIADFIARDSPKRALTFVAELRASSIVIERIVHGARDVAALPPG